MRENIAIYMRLSKEEDQRDGESNSISTQRILLRQYVTEHFRDYRIWEYYDDGYSGVNLERPSIGKLLEDVEERKVDCIVVKDFSRFARNYIELGTWLEKIFPVLGVRFISVNDGYDSLDYPGGTGDLSMCFRNLLYDLYSRDLSEKVRTSLEIRKKRGWYVSANTPFGYKRALQDRHMLVIAEEEARIVREIFNMALCGELPGKIADRLNKAKRKTPLEFRVEKGETRRKPQKGNFIWYGSCVGQILKNQVYIGNLVQKKYGRDFLTGKRFRLPEKEWIITRNHHAPIVEREVFFGVQAQKGNRRGD